MPVGDELAWSYPPFAAIKNNGFLYGRGSADMKGAIVAMVVAVEEFLATGTVGSIGTLSSSGTASGTVSTVASLGSVGTLGSNG